MSSWLTRVMGALTRWAEDSRKKTIPLSNGPNVFDRISCFMLLCKLINQSFSHYIQGKVETKVAASGTCPNLWFDVLGMVFISRRSCSLVTPAQMCKAEHQMRWQHGPFHLSSESAFGFSNSAGPLDTFHRCRVFGLESGSIQCSPNDGTLQMT